MANSSKRFDLLDYTYKLLVVAALLITACILASDILIPICFSAILSIVLLPGVKFLERKLSPALSISLVLIFTLSILVLIIWLTVNQITGLINDLPNLEAKFSLVADRGNDILRDYFNLNKAERSQLIKSGITNLSSYATNLLASTTNLISFFIQIPIYIFLILIYRDRFKAFFESLLSSSAEFTWKKEVETVIQGYISGLALVTVIIAALNTVGLLILGIEH